MKKPLLQRVFEDEEVGDYYHSTSKTDLTNLCILYLEKLETPGDRFTIRVAAQHRDRRYPFLAHSRGARVYNTMMGAHNLRWFLERMMQQTHDHGFIRVVEE